jgi:hydrophobic/amphiphilic exporter-1 (mainly G- bacteria), HAE1 family
LLTLVVVPVAYCYMDDLAQWFKSFFKPNPTHAPAKIEGLPQSAE